MPNSKQEVLTDPRDLINKHIADNGLKQSWVADQIGISSSHFSLVLNKERELSESNREKLNLLFETDY